jgi:transmembrane sensor
MVVNRIWILMSKKVAGEATPEDLAELDSLMSGRIDNTYPLREIEEMWNTTNKDDHKSLFEIKRKWDRFKGKLPEETRILVLSKKNHLISLLAAACALFVITGIVLITRGYEKTDLATTIVQSPAGSTTEVKLPDGTKVWLNAKSQLIYKKQFGEKYREVTLIGEAFFDVVKDASHPFIVNTTSLKLKVLGTAFNVRSYAKDKTSEASLVRGAIEVTLLNHPDKRIILKPTEKITVRNTTNETDKLSVTTVASANTQQKEQIPLITLSNIHYQEADPLPQEAQWIERKLVFTSENFEDLAARMERYFDITIDFQDTTIKELSFSGSFKDENINEAMKALQATAMFHYKIVKNKITIYK